MAKSNSRRVYSEIRHFSREPSEPRTNFEKIFRPFCHFLLSFAVSSGFFLIFFYFRDYLSVQNSLIVSISCGFAISIVFTWSKFIRCVLLISLPQLGTGQGRIIMLSIVTSLLFGGPLVNILENAQTVTKSISCIGEKMENAAESDLQNSENFAEKFNRLVVYNNNNDIQFNFSVGIDDDLIPNKNFSDIQMAVKSKARDVLYHTNLAIQILKYILEASIILIPINSALFLRKFMKNQKHGKSDEEIIRKFKISKEIKQNLSMNLCILGFHIVLSTAVIGFDWILFEIEQLTFEELKDLSFERGNIVNVNLSRLMTSPHFDVENDNLNASTNTPDKDSTNCFTEPKSIDKSVIWTICGFYSFVFICIFIGAWASRFRCRIVYYFYPDLRRNSTSLSLKKTKVKNHDESYLYT